MLSPEDDTSDLSFNRSPRKKTILSERAPELPKQWHTDRNGELKPSDVAPHSREKVWWKCTKKHEHVWEAASSTPCGDTERISFASGVKFSIFEKHFLSRSKRLPAPFSFARD